MEEIAKRLKERLRLFGLTVETVNGDFYIEIPGWWITMVLGREDVECALDNRSEIGVLLDLAWTYGYEEGVRESKSPKE